ncbi:hypothetical protein DYB25_013253, partial [Aphanomyces astaci]
MVRPMFLALAKLVRLASVLTAIFGHMSVVKTPQAQFECLEFVRESVGEFGMPTCNPHGVIEYVKEPFGLASSSPKTRVSAIAVFGSLYGQLGDAMRPLLNLDGWKLSLKDCVEAEFDGVGFNPSSFAVSRAVNTVVEEAKISKELLADMANEHDKVAWKKRLGAMEQTQQICEKAGLSIDESNANIKTKSVHVMGGVVASVGPSSVAKLANLVGSKLVVGVADNKNAMQQACLDSLRNWVVHGDVASASCSRRCSRSWRGRAELLGWTVEMTHMVADKMDLRTMVKTTIDTLLDKSTVAWDKAQLLLVKVFTSVGRDAVQAGCRGTVLAKM